jgi:hypothetical protein
MSSGSATELLTVKEVASEAGIFQQALEKHLGPGHMKPDYATAGCRGNHIERISKWGCWLHRFVRVINYSSS